MTKHDLPDDARDLLTAWFGELDREGLADDAHVERWWKKDPAFDAELRERFGALNAEAREGGLRAWLKTPRGTLAYVILLDQVSRNIHRDTPEMYTADARALEVAKAALADGATEAALAVHERVFLYMPLMHSEAVADQRACVACFERLAGSLDGWAKASIEANLQFARAHRDIVERFGRFPHRNDILGRETTAEEREFLKQPGSSF